MSDWYSIADLKSELRASSHKRSVGARPPMNNDVARVMHFPDTFPNIILDIARQPYGTEDCFETSHALPLI